MSDKKFKIKPKVWPKEYTFEEFKQLNPNISENLLVNYYNKYLQEYAENRSRHITHFNDTKDKLSKELKLLNEKLISNISDNYDRDTTVGPTGAGRAQHKPFSGDIVSMHTAATTDNGVIVSEDNAPFPPGSSLRPYGAVTVAAWFRNPTAYQDFGSPFYDIFDCYFGGGYLLTFYNKKPMFNIAICDGDGTKTDVSVDAESGTFMTDQVYHTPDDWHLLVGTYDCRAVDNGDGTFTGQAKLYVDGALAKGQGTAASPSYNATGHTFDFDQSTGLGTSGSKGSIYYDGDDGVQAGYGKFAPGIGRTVGVNSSTGIINTTTSRNNTSVAQIAVWDKALSAEAVYDIYNAVASGSSGNQHDLSYKGNTRHYEYDVFDEGLDYTNIGPYAKNLQLWYRLDELTSSSIAVDSSGKGLYGSYHNLPVMSQSFGPGLKGNS